MTIASTPLVVPPFAFETAVAEVHRVEEGWHSRRPELVSRAYTVGDTSRHRSEFSRIQIVPFPHVGRMGRT